MKTLQPIKAAPIDDDAFRLLAFPFTGPIPKAGTRGVDLDGEFFSQRTDIKADWLPFRPTDWHHGADPTKVMGRTVIGKAVDLGSLDGPGEPDEEGWWVTVWLEQGQKRLDLIRRLAERGAQIFGSSESVPGLTKKAADGEILVWPYWRQTLSTSPQNTHSVIRPLKATLDEIEAAGEHPNSSFWFDLEAALRALAPSLRVPSLSAFDAKAGRVLSAANETDLKEALEALRAGLDRLDQVVRRQPDYQPKLE